MKAAVIPILVLVTVVQISWAAENQFRNFEIHFMSLNETCIQANATAKFVVTDSTTFNTSTANIICTLPPKNNCNETIATPSLFSDIITYTNSISTDISEAIDTWSTPVTTTTSCTQYISIPTAEEGMNTETTITPTTACTCDISTFGYSQVIPILLIAGILLIISLVINFSLCAFIIKTKTANKGNPTDQPNVTYDTITTENISYSPNNRITPGILPQEPLSPTNSSGIDPITQDNPSYDTALIQHKGGVRPDNDDGCSSDWENNVKRPLTLPPSDPHTTTIQRNDTVTYEMVGIHSGMGEDDEYTGKQDNFDIPVTQL